MIRYLLIFLYITFNILLFFFNWDLFTLVVPIDFIFSDVLIMPFLVVQLFGLIILLMLWAIEYKKDIKQDLKVTKLENELMDNDKDNEIASLKGMLEKEKSVE